MNRPDGVPADAAPDTDPATGPEAGAGAGTDVAVPRTALTSRSIRTFVIRNGRLTDAQEQALGRLLPRYGIDRAGAARALPPEGVATLFPHAERPLRVEVGFGNGDALLEMAAAEPGINHLGIEVHAPGVGHALLGLEALEAEGRGLDNVRVCRHDAIEVLDTLCTPGSVERVYVFFPDPWIKKRHHKRRILQGDFLSSAARVLAPGGLLHAATDVVEYADWMLERLAPDPRFAAADGVAPRPAWRPRTRFERRGGAARPRGARPGVRAQGAARRLMETLPAGLSAGFSLTPDKIAMLVLLGTLIVLFVFEVLRVDVAAIVVMVLLGLVGSLPGIEAPLSGNELFSGFSSDAVMSVIAVMIIGAGLDKTGLMSRVAQRIVDRGGRGERRVTALLCVCVAGVSAVMQNIGAAALFLPVVGRVAARTNRSVARLLMPVGFCAILGGTLTMIGSSPLILLNDLLRSANARLPAVDRMEPFGLFDVTPVGLALVTVGTLYLVLAGRWVLPSGAGAAAGPRSSRASDYFERVYGIKGELFEARVTDTSPQVGRTVQQVEEASGNSPPILALYSGDVVKIPPDREETLWVGTRLGLMGDRAELETWCDANGWALEGAPDRFADVLNPQYAGIAEIVVPPGSSLVGRPVGDIKPRRTFGINILQIYRSDSIIRHHFRDEVLRAGDTLVVHASWRDLNRLQRNRARDFVLATEVRYEDLRTDKIGLAVLWLGLALALFLLSDSLAVSLLTGAVGMVLTGVLGIDEAYGAVSWQTVFLLAALIPLGIAFDRTGTAAWIAQQLLLFIGDVPVWTLQAVMALLATFFTLVMSNIGATVLLVPLAINLAIAVGADPATFALIVAVSTSNSFLLPTHQVNALIMGPGGYRVVDFMRAGGIMTLLFLVTSLVVIELVR